eukprot:7530522-Ditylum_brightwellii.AAC.1
MILVPGALQFNEVALSDSDLGIHYPIMFTVFNTSHIPSTRSIFQPPTLSVPAFAPSLVKIWNLVQMHLYLLPCGNQ